MDAGRDAPVDDDAGLDGGLDVGSDAGASDTPRADAPGAVCGGRSMHSCPGTQVCGYAIADQCGAFDATGTCEERPTTCGSVLSPVCGCDGVTYDNACEARRAGTSARSTGECVSHCDGGEVTCGTPRPSCMVGVTTAAVIDGCWGPCVPIETCVCASRSDCPNDAERCDLATMRCAPR